MGMKWLNKKIVVLSCYSSAFNFLGILLLIRREEERVIYTHLQES